MRTIYIAGKVTGEDPEECAAKFEAAEVQIRAKGFEVINPIKLVNNIYESWDAAMVTCLNALGTAQGIFMLPCSVNSKGAQIELEAAFALNLDIYSDLNDLQ
ncbi:DUF4406 domain-containing protein [Flavobacterium sp. N1994]|uniref:DUF4406 domain-containing protein n=1 Tax=Flavobacterium sp. N1994 TaxID=2986827 RepID=UPI002221F337|nr:DUF4406 domain-containing protein [Flavobacterium sp. N1994]